MEFRMFCILAFAILATTQSTGAPEFYPCPFLGSTYLKGIIPRDEPTILAAARNITAVIDDALATGSIENLTTAFSLTAFSTSDKGSTPFYEYHRTPSSLAEAPIGVTNVTRDSVYRLGSLSKVLTVYTLLVADGFTHFPNSITKFIPALVGNATGSGAVHGPINMTDWADITLEALASHLSGIGVEYGALDIAKSPFPYQEFGLPNVPKNELPPCGGPLSSPLCNREQFVRGIGQKHPVFPPFYSPSYSNAAFQLLAYAIENITGKSFPDTLQTKVFSPLNMTHSSYEKPSDSLGVIPLVSQDLYWNVSAGDLNPAMGFYASPSDLATFGRAVLSSQQLTPVQTRRWMKPLAHTSDPYSSVGAPWEISRYTLPSDPFKVVDLYAKSGGYGLYSAYLILVPDYDIGFSVNVAGSTAPTGSLANILTEAFVPAFEEAARLQSQARYAGNYTSLDKQYSFLLETDPRSPGLHLTNFTGPNNTNEYATLAAIAPLGAAHYAAAEQALPLFQDGTASEAYSEGLFGIELDLRLFPTLLEDKLEDGSRRTSFRAALGTSVSEQPGPFTAPCGTWLILDTLELGAKSFDEFIFTVDKGGNATTVENGFLRQKFHRV